MCLNVITASHLCQALLCANDRSPGSKFKNNLYVYLTLYSFQELSLTYYLFKIVSRVPTRDMIFTFPGGLSIVINSIIAMIHDLLKSEAHRNQKMFSSLHFQDPSTKRVSLDLISFHPHPTSWSVRSYKTHLISVMVR